MEESYTFFPNKLNINNIRSYSAKLSSAEELKICELADIARDTALFIKKMLDEGLDLYDVLYMLGDFVSGAGGELFIDTIDKNVCNLDTFLKILNRYDASIFCNLLIEYLEKARVDISEKHFFKSLPTDECFVYVKNVFSDEAYDVFSQDFKDPRVRYADNFKDALKLVNDNAATFCLLPIEERGSRLPTVDELIFRGDYKINSVIPVFGYDGNAELKYALVSKNIYQTEYLSDDDRYFEIRLPTDSAGGLLSLAVSAEAFGMIVHRINTLGFKTEDGEKGYFSVVFKSLGCDFSRLLLYLTIFLPEYIPVGVYKNLE